MRARVSDIEVYTEYTTKIEKNNVNCALQNKLISRILRRMDYKDINFLKHEDTTSRILKRRRIFFLSSGIVVVILLGILVVRTFVHASFSNNPKSYDPITLQPKPASNLLEHIAKLVFNDNARVKGVKNDRVNILLLGMGGPGHAGPYLSDTMIILSIKPSTKQIALISIPRDLLVNIPNHGWQKINAADAYGEVGHPGKGPILAAKIIQKTFGIPIQYYIRVDFQAFVDMVNDVGGITINVQRPFTDRQYPTFSNTTQTIQFTTGIHTMNGTRALEFARSRHGNNGEGSDFARAHRQQKMLLALKQKILSFKTLSNPIKISNILQTLAAHITTNMQFGDVMGFLSMAKELDMQHSTTLVLDDSPNGFLVSGMSARGSFILEPKTGNFTAISSAIQNIFTKPVTNATIVNSNDIQSTPPKHDTIEILNGTWRAGLAVRIKKELEYNTFSVGKIGNTPNRPITHSAIYQITQTLAPDVLQKLKQTLHIPIEQTIPTGIITASSTDILIVLGENFQQTNNNISK